MAFPGNTIAWGLPASRGFILKKNLRPFYVFCDDISFLPHPFLSFLTYTRNVLLHYPRIKDIEKKKRIVHHIQTFLWVQITSTFGDYTQMRENGKGGGEKNTPGPGEMNV